MLRIGNKSNGIVWKCFKVENWLKMSIGISIEMSTIGNVGNGENCQSPYKIVG